MQTSWPVAVLVGAFAMLPAGLNAQSSLDIRAAAALTELYDSNIFATASSPEADVMTRVTPSFAAGYRDPRLKISGRYTLDAERYTRHAELSSVHARQQGTVDMAYSVTSRVVWGANAEIAMTRTPGELFVQTGLMLPRARTSRVTGRSRLTREWDSRTDGTAEYVFSEDRIHGEITVRTHGATLGAVRRLSSRTSTRIEYLGTQDSFLDRPGATADTVSTTSVLSHALVAGWSHAVTGRVRIAVNAGPRLIDGRFAPELLLSLQSRRDRGDVSLSYQRTQTTVIGVARPVAVEAVTSQLVWGSGRGPSAHITPAFLRNRAGGLRTDVYRVAVGVEYPIGQRLSVDLAVDASMQSGRLQQALPEGAISRHTATIRLVTTPRIRRSQ